MDINEFTKNYTEDLDFKEIEVSREGENYTAVRRYVSSQGLGVPILKLKDKDWNSRYEFEHECKKN
jgi:hypothetical protein